MGARIADRWFDVTRLEDGIARLHEPYAHPFIRCNIWHVRGRDRDLVIDTGLGVASLRAAGRELFGARVTAVATHFHYDHVGGLHEFEERVAHASEAALLASPPPGTASLRADFFPAELRAELAELGQALDEELITAYPHAGFDVAAYAIRPAAPTVLVDEGDVLDLGDRAFEVLHLPGHSPGSIGLWEPATGTLFSGDALYDGLLLDDLPGSDVRDYCATIARLRALPVRVVHAGHEPSFGRARLIELADTYLERRAGAARD